MQRDPPLDPTQVAGQGCRPSVGKGTDTSHIARSCQNPDLHPDLSPAHSDSSLAHQRGLFLPGEGVQVDPPGYQTFGRDPYTPCRLGRNWHLFQDKKKKKKRKQKNAFKKQETFLSGKSMITRQSGNCEDRRVSPGLTEGAPNPAWVCREGGQRRLPGKAHGWIRRRGRGGGGRDRGRGGGRTIRTERLVFMGVNSKGGEKT